ncbi:MAG TPA: HAMP domain-containing sensor histidine kinase [Cyclobacteriaceae bacterium]|nr:HAMP domain-containing sensor histidine kinase [Cyclobacteriaceae bacterium]
MTLPEVLRFSKKKEDAFQQFFFKQDLIVCRATSILVVSILALLMAIDYFRVSDFSWVLIARLIVVVVLIILLSLTYQKDLKAPTLQLWLLLINLVFLGSLFFMDAMTTMPAFYLTNSIVVYIFIASTVSGLRYRYSSVLNIMLVILFLFYFPTSGNAAFHKSQIPNIFISLNVSLLIGFVWERHKRINFLQQSQLNNLINIFSHDMVSPLNSLLSLLSLNDRQLLEKSEFDTHVESIKKTTANNILLLQNLVKWSKSQMDGFVPKAEIMEVRPLVDEAVNLLQHTASEKNVVIHNRTAHGDMCVSDSEMTKLILRNTLSNAIKFSHPNGAIEIYSKQDNGYVMLSIKDEGIGMSGDEIDRLFTMRVQSSPGTANERGTGIGLYLTKEFVTLNKGEIRIESTKGKGSMVKITLPSEI